MFLRDLQCIRNFTFNGADRYRYLEFIAATLTLHNVATIKAISWLKFSDSGCREGLLLAWNLRYLSSPSRRFAFGFAANRNGISSFFLFFIFCGVLLNETKEKVSFAALLHSKTFLQVFPVISQSRKCEDCGKMLFHTQQVCLSSEWFKRKAERCWSQKNAKETLKALLILFFQRLKNVF